MAVPAPIETQEIPAKIEGNKVDNEIVHTPAQETAWTQGVVQEVQKIPEVGSSFKTEHAIPDASKHIPGSEALKKVGAERVGVEQHFDPADITDIAIKTAGHTVGLINQQEGLSVHAETSSNRSKILPLMVKRARKLFNQMRHPVKKAA